MTREEAFKYCASIQRKLAQPKSQSENQFYGEFGRKVILAIKQNVNGTKISNVDRIVVPVINKGSALEKQLRDSKVYFPFALFLLCFASLFFFFVHNSFGSV